MNLCLRSKPLKRTHLNIEMGSFFYIRMNAVSKLCNISLIWEYQ
nr:MAG TPA: hypothetical protein [Caudoviricetes sp.]